MQNYEPIDNLIVRKSNEFVLSKYNSTLLENKIMLIALSRIEITNDIDAPLEARLYPSELKKLVSDEKHIYRDLIKLAHSITGHTMFIEDRKKGDFKVFSVVPNAEYTGGVFIIKFNQELRSHVLGLGEKNNDIPYTSYGVSVGTNFSSNSSFRLYEVLRKDVYRIKKNVANEACVVVEYNISELKFIIGLANADDPIVKSEIAKQRKNIDWDDLYEKLDKKNKKYKEWRDLNRRILKPAQIELENKSDIRFEYEPLHENKKAKRIRFTIYRNVPKNLDEINKDIETLEMNNRTTISNCEHSSFILEFIGHNKLTKDNIELLLNKADGDENIVREAINMADQQDNINNYMGWLISCIENNYMEVPTVNGSAEKAEILDNIKKDYEANKMFIAQKAWEKIKSKEEFPEFASYIQRGGVELEQLEYVYDVQELTQAFVDWKCNRIVKL